MLAKIISLFRGRSQFFYATAVLIGTMVGAGVFAIPFSFSKSGFGIGFIFLIIIGLATLVLSLMYGEVILRTENRHQIVGYTQKYLGDNYKRLIFFSILLSVYTATLAYIIAAGDFLNNILGGLFSFSNSFYSLFLYLVLSLLVLAGIKTVSHIELIMAIFFAILVILILVLGVPKIFIDNFKEFRPVFWYLPYGVLIFAFAGYAGIPAQRRILESREYNLKKSITTAIIFVGVLYLIFSFVVLGVSDGATSPDAISGLFDMFGSKIIFIGSLFGLFAISTSFLMLSSALVQTFRLDYKLSEGRSWLIFVIPPPILFWFGFRTFVDLINLAGAVAIGLEGIIIVLIYVKARQKGDRLPEYSLNLPKPLLYLLIFMFLGGMVYALIFR